ncbi:MAG: 4Fe-4S binding protein [Gammaproteobacteria bacterium]|nr:4Fe-4S binding protein [Gammaproteobacteria bacterium]
MSVEKKQPGKKKRLARKEKARREFLRTIGLTAGVIGIAGLGYYPVAKSEVIRLRPPGALAEDEFLASCIKCGQCVQVCPVEAIKLADIMDGFGIGTPYIDARPQACDFSCDGLQCVLACPTGSLTHEINYPHETRMGFARLARPDKCLAMKGEGFKGYARGTDFKGVLRYDEIDRWVAQPVSEHKYDLELCDLCMRQCPIEIRRLQCEAGKPPSGDKNQCPPKRAIDLISIDSKTGFAAMKPEVLEGCVGCGVCEMICPTEPAAIVIEARATGVSV